MIIPEILKKEINEYCRANNITNIDEFTIKILKQGFTVEKFGLERLREVKREHFDKRLEVLKKICKI